MNVSLTGIKVCSFFGHRNINVDSELKERLACKVKSLIEEGYSIFYFGGYGEFDELCYKIVSKLKEEYNHIKRIFCVADEVHLRFDKRPEWLKRQEYEEYVCLDLPFNYWYKRIYYRNCEMIKKSDYIIFYVDENKEGGAIKALSFARKIKKQHINLFN